MGGIAKDYFLNNCFWHILSFSSGMSKSYCYNDRTGAMWTKERDFIFSRGLNSVKTMCLIFFISEILVGPFSDRDT